MSRRQNITLRGEDAERFNELRDRLSEQRVGDAIGPTEMVRVLLDRVEFEELSDSQTRR